MNKFVIGVIALAIIGLTQGMPVEDPVVAQDQPAGETTTEAAQAQGDDPAGNSTPAAYFVEPQPDNAENAVEKESEAPAAPQADDVAAMPKSGLTGLY